MSKFFKQKNTGLARRSMAEGFTRTPKFGVTPKGGGFTLVETLVAISIFSMSILGLLTILSQGISDTGYAKKKMIATYLNQEGIEYIRNMRDTFVLYDSVDSQTGWNAFKNKVAPGGNGICARPNDNGCYLEDQDLVYTDQNQPMTKVDVQVCGPTCPMLLYDVATGKYGYVSGVNSGYIRKITIDQISVDELKIFSTVSWTQGSGSYNVVFSESLFNWIE